MCEVGGYLLTKALSALWHCYEKNIEREGMNKKKNPTKCNKKKETQPMVERGRERGIVFLHFASICELQCLK